MFKRQKAPINKEEKAIYAAFETDPLNGLTLEEVNKRKAKGYTNKTPKHVTKSIPRIVFDNLFSVLNIILFVVFGLMVSAKLPLTSFVFMVILSANIILGLIQDLNARRLVGNLRVVAESKTTVLREAKKESIPSREIVLSDIVELTLGDQIPADSVVVSGEILVNESLLTGESAPVKKKPGDKIYSGTYVTKGQCLCRVISVGSDNYAEKLQKKASLFNRPASEIKRSINKIILVCATASVISGVLEAVIWGLSSPRSPYADFIKSFSGSMVAMIPAGMVLLTSLSLSVGVIALAKKRMLVQQLYCIEMLARVDMLCLDKTGTLTDGTMNAVEVIPLGETSYEEIALAVSGINALTKDNNATSKALIEKFGKETSYSALSVLPFDSEAKHSAVTIGDGRTFSLGAYSFVPSEPSKEVEDIIESYSQKGYRCLVLAFSNERIKDDKAPKGELKAVIVLSDKIKQDAPENIKWFQENGVSVRIISGDNPLTVSEIARKCGVIGYDKYVSLEGKSIEETKELAGQYVVFGRVSPEQKATLITSFKAQKHIVAMTGDGVNDILALKVADCSIAMASGSDAAKNVAHLVSLDSNFSCLPDVVSQGRRVINNLQRTCSLFLCKTIFAFAFTALFLVSSWFNSEFTYPFSTQSLLVWEIISIGLAAFFLALQPSNERLRGSFIKNILLKAIPGGLAATIAGIVPFIVFSFWPSGISASLTKDVAVTVAVISFTAVSFGILLAVCWPLDKYRFTVFLAMTLAGIGLMVADFFLRGALFGLQWDGFNLGTGIYMVCIPACCLLVYFLIDKLIFSKVRKHVEGDLL